MLNRIDSISSSENPSRLDWMIAIFLVIIQQNAFISTAYELLYPDDTVIGAVENGFNTASIFLSLILLIVACSPLLSRMRNLFIRNPFTILYIIIVLCSVLWSLHADLTIRRGLAYILTISIAAYIAVRFTAIQALTVLARAFSICAICSVVFIVVFPETGIMSGAELEGNWRGVYPHKNVFGFAMAVAVFVQLHLIASSRQRNLSAYVWAGFYFLLVVLSRSTTALMASIFYVFVTFNYLLWRRNKIWGYNLFLMVALAAVLLLPIFLLDPDLFFGVLGKDATLTGRTDVWDAVFELIGQKPSLGWGYRAMWVPTDSETVWINAHSGDWGAPSAHNAFIEVTLELGLLGLASLMLIIVHAFWRAVRCCSLGILPFGLFSLVFFIATIAVGQTIETLGTNQEIDWLTFNIFNFLAGERLAAIFPKVVPERAVTV